MSGFWIKNRLQMKVKPVASLWPLLISRLCFSNVLNLLHLIITGTTKWVWWSSVSSSFNWTNVTTETHQCSVKVDSCDWLLLNPYSLIFPDSCTVTWFVLVSIVPALWMYWWSVTCCNAHWPAVCWPDADTCWHLHFLIFEFCLSAAAFRQSSCLVLSRSFPTHRHA